MSRKSIVISFFSPPSLAFSGLRAKSSTTSGATNWPNRPLMRFFSRPSASTRFTVWARKAMTSAAEGATNST